MSLGKSLKLVVTFPSPMDAINFEEICEQHNIPGKLMPVPIQLTNDCGIGWVAKVEEKAIIKKFIEEQHIEIKLFTETVF